MLAAHHTGAPIADLEYDEVTSLLDVALARMRSESERRTAQLREVARSVATIAPPVSLISPLDLPPAKR